MRTCVPAHSGRLAAALRSWRTHGPSVSRRQRTRVSIALAFFVSALLSACWLGAIAKWRDARVPIVDLLIIAALCAGLALLPSVGWVLATLIMTLLITRTTDADGWPDTVLMVIGSNVVWLVARMMFLG
jgi:hypothetical protein